MKKLLLLSAFVLLFCLNISAQGDSLKDWLKTPYVSTLSAASSNNTLVFQVNQEGVRNIYKASAPDFKVEKITNFTDDDGLELTSVKLSGDGRWLVFVRGGEHSGNSAVRAGNPASLVKKQSILIHVVDLQNGQEKIMGEGDYPVFHPDGQSITFIRSGQAWTYSLNSQEIKPLFHVTGSVGGLQWSKDGKRLLFSSARSSHSFVGIFDIGNDKIRWLAPDFHRDRFPKWSPDEKSVAFIRTDATGTEVKPILERRHTPWSICVVNLESDKLTEIWSAPRTLAGSVPSWQGTFNMEWNLPETLTFLSYQDGWPHLYAISKDGKELTQLTKGEYTVDQITYSSDKSKILFGANAGKSKEDIDRKHIGMVEVRNKKLTWLTSGEGIEANPSFFNDNKSVAFLSSELSRPYLPAVIDINKPESITIIGEELLAGLDFSQHVKPQHVSFKSEDGTLVYGQLFVPQNLKSKAPGLVYIHGGPRRQMFLGWHFLDYYFADYILNQYLASQGFVVLSVNYRMGTGYGFDFQNPEKVGNQGASEYKDILASGKWLQQHPLIDPERVGVFGGSYGGYLTALALGKNSDIFVAGVDVHGVHSRLLRQNQEQFADDFKVASQIALESSPIHYVDNWRSPVLIIHADDDQNVAFTQSIDLYNRLKERNVEVETLVFPDDNHHWMVFKNLVKVKEATAEFLIRKVKNQ